MIRLRWWRRPPPEPSSTLADVDWDTGRDTAPMDLGQSADVRYSARRTRPAGNDEVVSGPVPLAD
jgi:hypothetical protein